MTDSTDGQTRRDRTLNFQSPECQLSFPLPGAGNRDADLVSETMESTTPITKKVKVTIGNIVRHYQSPGQQDPVPSQTP